MNAEIYAESGVLSGEGEEPDSPIMLGVYMIGTGELVGQVSANWAHLLKPIFADNGLTTGALIMTKWDMPERRRRRRLRPWVKWAAYFLFCAVAFWLVSLTGPVCDCPYTASG